MRKNLKPLQEYVDRYKDVIERQTGLGIDKVKVKPHLSSIPDFQYKGNSTIQKYFFKFCFGLTQFVFSDFFMFAANRTMVNSEKVIYASESPMYYLLPRKAKKRAVIHELSHFLQQRVNNLDNVDKKVKRKIEEGFAEYMALDYFTGIYDEKGINSYLQRARRVLTSKPHQLINRNYSIGYAFFKKVVEKTNCSALDIIRSPPTSLEELLKPELYIKNFGQAE